MWQAVMNLPKHSDVGLKDGDYNVVVESDIPDDQLDGAAELGEVSQDRQRVQAIHQRQREAGNITSPLAAYNLAIFSCKYISVTCSVP